MTTCRILKRSLATAWVCFVVAPASPAFARVEVQISHVGFPAVGGDIIRAGCWTPIYVDVSLVDQPLFDGSIRAAQLDTDGDEAFDSVEVHLRAESGGHTRIILYVLANPVAGDGKFAVELRDLESSVVQVISDGVLAARAVPSEIPDIVSHDDVVVLSVADAAIGRVKDLAGVQQGTSLRQTVHVAHISPTDLPEHWIGLEAVDYIVWDDARPELLSPRQLSALLEWCQFGGTLLIGASESAATFALTKPLAAIMPADILEILSVADLPGTRETLLGQPIAEERQSAGSWLKTPFPRPVPMALSKVRKDATVIVREMVARPAGPNVEADVVTRGRVGSGHIIFCAVRLHDLFSAPGTANTFFEKLFHFIPASGQNQAALTPVSLFSNIAGAVGFVRSRSAYLVITVLFALGYVVAATWGTWAFLGSRGWRHHSWTAFAAVALIAGLGAGMAVGAARGITDRLQQVAVIDAAAGESFGRGTVWFGLKTGIDKRLDLWMPSDWLMAREPEFSSCFLRPLPAGTDWRQGSSFADPEDYILRPASAEIAGARFRATLKRFEGRWEGPLGGQLTSQIAVQGKDKLMTEDSYVVNNLGVELTQCRLIQTLLDPGAISSERTTATFVYTIDGTLPADGTKVRLYDRCFRLTGPQKPSDILRQAELKNRHGEWSSQFAGLLQKFSFSTSDDPKAALGKEKEALMLLSTIGDFDPGALPGQFAGSYTLSRDRLRHLDLREHLTAGHAAKEGALEPAQPTGTMVLIGFARGGGPIRLLTRAGERPFAPITPEEDSSWCMYRIRLPFVDLDKLAQSSAASPAPGSTRERNP